MARGCEAWKVSAWWKTDVDCFNNFCHCVSAATGSHLNGASCPRLKSF